MSYRMRNYLSRVVRSDGDWALKLMMLGLPEKRPALSLDSDWCVDRIWEMRDEEQDKKQYPNASRVKYIKEEI